MADNFTAASVAAGDAISAKDIGGGVKAQRALLQSIVAGAPVDASTSNPVPTADQNLATQVGAAGTSPPALASGASGLIGWLRKIVDSATSNLGAAGDTPPSLATNASGVLGWMRKIVDSIAALSAATSVGTAVSLAVPRPNDTAAYLALDVIGTSTSAGGAVLSFASIGPSGGTIIITSADLRIDVNAIPSGMTSFCLHLYNGSPNSNLGDNGAWDLTSGDRATYLGYIDLGAPVDVGSTLFCQVDGVNKQVKLSGGTTLYGYLVTIGAYTPAAQTNHQVRLNAIPA